MKRQYTFLTRSITAFSLVLAFASCMKDKNPVCPADVTLRFSYTYNADNRELFREEVEEVYIYAFDRNNHLYSSQRIPANRIGDDNTYTLQIEEGDYKIVAWGNFDPDSYALVQEDTRSSSMAVRPVTGPDGQVGGDVASLFYGTAEVTADRQTTNEATVSFIKNTKHINVLLPTSGTRTIEGTDISVRITASNGIIDFDNNTADAPTIYKPEYSRTLYQNGIYDLAAFKVLKLTLADRSSIQLYRGGELSREDDLIRLLTSHFPQIQTDPDLERYSEYTFIYDQDDNGTYVLTTIKVGPWSKQLGQQGGI